ncbi:MAG TPA: class II fructose-bisphosphatase [Alphaproteobacteria bacterium]
MAVTFLPPKLDATDDVPFAMDRNLALEVVRVTESAALAASLHVGRGDEKAADQAAVDAMRLVLNTIDIDGRIVIGEGERDEAPMLYIGERVGTGKGPKIDIALDPLEGTTATAKGAKDAMTVIAMTEAGGFLNAPDVYMQKIAVGNGLPADFLDLDEPPADFVRRLAKALDKRPDQITISVQERVRHEAIIEAIRGVGAKVNLFMDGDVAAAMSVSEVGTTIDAFMGTGGAPEGVLAAAGLQCIGGQMLGRLIFRNAEEESRGERWGITDFNRIYTHDDMAYGPNVMFAATGVTEGHMLPGVQRYKDGAVTHSIVMRSKTGTVRKIEAVHNFNRKPVG